MASTLPHYFIKITGKDQGEFPKNSELSPDGYSTGYRLRFKSESPLDANRGGQKAVRNVGPLYVLTPVGASTPHVMQAHWSNETLKDVVIELLTNEASGKATPYFTLELKNATIVSFDFRNGEDLNLPGVDAADVHQFIEIAFHCEEITAKHVKSKSVAKYDWKNKTDLASAVKALL